MLLIEKVIFFFSHTWPNFSDPVVLTCVLGNVTAMSDSFLYQKGGRCEGGDGVVGEKREKGRLSYPELKY